MCVAKYGLCALHRFESWLAVQPPEFHDDVAQFQRMQAQYLSQNKDRFRCVYGVTYVAMAYIMMAYVVMAYRYGNASAILVAGSVLLCLWCGVHGRTGGSSLVGVHACVCGE